MSPEDISFRMWQVEQCELKAVREALRQADSGRLVPHSTVKQLFKSRHIPNAPVVLRCEMSEAAKIKWSDAVIGRLRSTWEYFDRCSGGIDLREGFLGRIFSTIEVICKHPNIGRSGRVRGTREWYSGEGSLIVYRELFGEIQVLGVLVTHRKWPRMKTANA